MNRPARIVSRRTRRLLAAACLVAFWAGSTMGDEVGRGAAPATRPSYPALEQLHAECVALHRSLDGSVLRVQMPTPIWLADAAKNNPVDRYGSKLTPEVKRALENRARAAQQRGNEDSAAQSQLPDNNRGGARGQYNNEQQSQQPAQPPAQPTPQQQQQFQQTLIVPQQSRAVANDYNGNTYNGNAGQIAANATATTQPFGQTLTINSGQIAGNVAGPNNSAYNFVVPNGDQSLQNDNAQRLNVNVRNTLLNNATTPNVFSPNTVGLLLDQRGHVLVPIFVEREAVGDRPVKLAVGDGEPMDAVFVGSDRQTDITILRLTAPASTTNPTKRPARVPVRLSADRPADGGLVLVINPADGAGKLAVWNGGSRDYGVVVTIDGKVAGIARFGQFLSGSACRLIADQIVRHGTVRRATLGVIITQIDANDPARRAIADLGDRLAVRIDQVMKNSVADQAGLRPGDILMALGGESVFDIPSIAAAVAAKSGPTEVRILRDGKPMTLSVNLIQQ